MKKFYVIYSLTQKLTPTLYKSKTTVNKYLNASKGIKYEEFDFEENANKFIQQLKNVFKTNQYQKIKPKDVRQILKQMHKNQIQNQSSEIDRKQAKSHEFTNQQWTLLSKDHRLKDKQQIEQKFDSSYSSPNFTPFQKQAERNSFKNDSPFISQVKNQFQPPNNDKLFSKNSSNFSPQQSQSSLVSQDLTTEDYTQQDSRFSELFSNTQLSRSSNMMSNNKNNKKQKPKYYILFNPENYQTFDVIKSKMKLYKFMEDLTNKQPQINIIADLKVQQFDLRRAAKTFLKQMEVKHKNFIKQKQKINKLTYQNQLQVKKEQLKNIVDKNIQKQKQVFQQIQITKKQIQNKQKEVLHPTLSSEIKVEVVQSHNIKPHSSTDYLHKQLEQETPSPQQLVKTFHPKVHPFNKTFLLQKIMKRVQQFEKQQKQNLQKKQIIEQSEKQLNQEYDLYPKLQIKQNPGYSIGSYILEKAGTIIKQDKIILGQTKKEEGHLLTLAFSLASIKSFGSKKISIHLNPQIKKTKQYTFKIDREMAQMQKFFNNVEKVYKERIQYIV